MEFDWVGLMQLLVKMDQLLETWAWTDLVPTTLLDLDCEYLSTLYWQLCLTTDVMLVSSLSRSAFGGPWSG